eukprot:188337_1
MSLVNTRLALWFALAQWFVNLVCSNVYITCPRIPGPPDSLPNALPSQSYAHPLSLNSSCFGIDIALNVENILPDPSYFSPATNMDVVANALHKTLRDHNVYGLTVHALNKEAAWSTINQCPHKTDKTVDKLYFQTTAHDIYCNHNTIKVDGKYIECEFQTPPSIAYQFTLHSVYALLRMQGHSISVHASIFNTTNDELLAQSPAETIANRNAYHEFIFSPLTLTHDTVYSLKISIVSGVDSSFESIGSESRPLLSTIAAPNACVLGPNIAVGSDMKWGLAAFCNATNAAKRSFFENYIYQKHSSQTYIPAELPPRRRLRIHPEARDSYNDTTTLRPVFAEVTTGSKGGSASLHKLYTDGDVVQIANDEVAPAYSQCLAIDPDTWRVFSVGGHVNGAALSRLAVHRIDSLDQAQRIGSLSLDRARSGAMCHYWLNKEDGEQYIIVMNGMAQAYDTDVDHWFNDIVFIPLNPANTITFPPIRLAHNVIDMKTYVTESDELYLIGGRDGCNAVNSIQSIRLEHVLEAALLNDGTVLHTMDRMEPMLWNLVSPFVDTVRVRNKTCLMIFGGQNVVHNEWIDTQIPSPELQLICNDNLRPRTSATEMNYFTAFDEAHLQSVMGYSDYKETNDVFLTDYTFVNDDIWYEFSASFKVCNVESGQVSTTLNAFETDSDVLQENILSESQKAFAEWNDGFGDVTIADLNFIVASSGVSLNEHCVGLSHSVCEGLRLQGNNGDQVCGFNSVTHDCYAIQRAPAGHSDHIRVDAEHESVSHALSPSDKLPLIVMLIVTIGVLVLLIVCGACTMYLRNKNTNNIHKQAAIAMETVMDVDANEMDTHRTHTTNDMEDVMLV